MATRNMLYQKQYAVNDKIKIVIPTVGEIIDNEDEYYNLISIMTAMPIDLMVELDDAGIDFTTLNDYELFLIMFSILKDKDTSLLFGDLDLSLFDFQTDEDTGSVILVDNINGIKINKAIYSHISSALRKIHHLEKNRRKPANEEAKEYMLRRAREKRKRNKNRKDDSQLESLIVAMVNTSEYKYDFEGTRELSIFQFNESVRQVIKKIDYDNRMYGVYAGTINPKDLSQDDLNWLIHK